VIESVVFLFFFFFSIFDEEITLDLSFICRASPNPVLKKLSEAEVLALEKSYANQILQDVTVSNPKSTPRRTMSAAIRQLESVQLDEHQKGLPTCFSCTNLLD
jgi:hypothetical protein